MTTTPITERNARVLELLRAGKKYPEISLEMGLSPGVVAGIAYRAQKGTPQRTRRVGCSVRMLVHVTKEMEAMIRGEAEASQHTVSDEIRAAICAYYGIKDR